MKLTKRLNCLILAMAMTMSTSSVLSVSAENITSDTNNIISMDTGTEAETARTITSKTISMTVKKQQYDKWCWAACAEAFTKKYLSSSYTQTDIATSILGSATNNYATLTKVKNFLNTSKSNEVGLSYVRSYFAIKSTDSNCVDSECISFSTIKSYLDEDKPLILRCTKHGNNKSVSHMVVCYGYRSDTSSNNYDLLIYDPDTSTTNARSVTANTTSTSAFQFTDFDTFYVYDVEAILYAA